MATAEKNLFGFGNSGSTYGYRPYVQTAYATVHNPVATKQAVRATVRRQAFTNRIGVATAQAVQAQHAEASAADLIKRVAAASSTADEAQARLKAALDYIRPGASRSVQNVAAAYARQGVTSGPAEGMKRAIAEEIARIPPPTACEMPLSDFNDSPRWLPFALMVGAAWMLWKVIR